MLSQTFLLTAIGAAVCASAAMHGGGHLAVKRDLMARQTDSAFPSDTALPSGYGCVTALASIYEALPTPPPDLVSWEMTVSITDPCHFTVPKSIESELSSYETQIESFYSQYSSAIESALSECPSYSTEYSSLQTTITGITDTTDICKTNAATTSATKTAASVSATTTGATSPTVLSGTSASSSSGSSSTASPNAGPRETGLVAAAFAVAGLVGAVAVL